AVPDGPAVAVRGLAVAYGAIRAVQGVDIDAPRGQITALIGSNGAGKSSTLNAIAGLVPVAGGSVEIGGVDATRLPAHVRVVERGVVLIPEARAAFLTMTVRENLGLGVRVGREREARGHQSAFTLAGEFRVRDRAGTHHHARPRITAPGRCPPQGGLPRGGRCGRSTCTRGREGAISLTEFLQYVIDGLGSGTLYVLVAIGFTLVFGVM